MQNRKIYALCQGINWLTVAFCTIAFMRDLSLALTLDSIASKILYVLLATMMLTCLRVRMLEVQRFRYEHERSRISAEWGEPVAADHGATIPEFITNVRDEAVEYVAFFTEDEQKLCESTINCPSMVTVSDADKVLVLQHPHGVMIHNHPGEEPIAFSPEDLVYLATGICQKSIVVTSSFCYTMEAPKGFCINPKIVRRLGRRFYRGGSPSEASLNFCLEVAAHLGWHFEVMVPVFVAVCEETEE